MLSMNKLNILNHLLEDVNKYCLFSLLYGRSKKYLEKNIVR